MDSWSSGSLSGEHRWEADELYQRQIYVGRFPFDVEKFELVEQFFNLQYLSGDEDDVEIRRSRGARRKYAFITFVDREEQRLALEAVPYFLRGGELAVSPRRRPDRRSHPVPLFPSFFFHEEPPAAAEEEEEEEMVGGESSPPPTITGPISAHATLLSRLRKKQDDLEAEYANKFFEVTTRLSDLDKETTTKREERKELEKKLSTLDVEIATFAAAKDISEKEFVRFGQEHDARVAQLKEEIRQFSAAVAAPDANRVGTFLQDEMQCPCCLNRLAMGGEIFQCNEGHLVCGTCHRRLCSCPICRAPYPSEGIRNRLAERLTQFGTIPAAGSPTFS